jgi:hypothetical protein
MLQLSEEQQAVVDAPVAPLTVIACAGSGKTATAIHRLAALRMRLGSSRGRVALLSFTNVAVDTFRTGYSALATSALPADVRRRVDIDTLDGFLTRMVLRPHAARTMGSHRAAYLVTGHEPFLQGYRCRHGDRRVEIREINVTMETGRPAFFYSPYGRPTRLDTREVLDVVQRLGRAGAYTHNLGRYWSYRTLLEQPAILRALARRYPHLLIDEAQDLGAFHQATLQLFIETGVQVSLIGDPNQGIYEFAGADGRFLCAYQERFEALSFQLTRNYRSGPALVRAANRLCGRDDAAARMDDIAQGYFLGYSEAELPELLDAFRTEVEHHGIRVEHAAVLCRLNDLVARCRGSGPVPGAGQVKTFAQATLLRDRHDKFFEAFKSVCRAVVALMDDTPKSLLAQLVGSATDDPVVRRIRRRLWSFTRDPDCGLPSAQLHASGEWHQLLLLRVRTLLQELASEVGLVPTGNLGRKLSRRDLPECALDPDQAPCGASSAAIRIGTVHSAKGESIAAVLYIAGRGHGEAMLDGTNTELGRIGYVALTRARDLFWLAVPANVLPQMRPRLAAFGLREVGMHPMSQGARPEATGQAVDA